MLTLDPIMPDRQITSGEAEANAIARAEAQRQGAEAAASMTAANVPTGTLPFPGQAEAIPVPIPTPRPQESVRDSILTNPVNDPALDRIIRDFPIDAWENLDECLKIPGFDLDALEAARNWLFPSTNNSNSGWEDAWEEYENYIDPGSWGGGHVSDPGLSLQQHYEKHGSEVGASSVEEYRDMSELFRQGALGRGDSGIPIDGATPNVERFYGGGLYIDVQVTTGEIISFGSQ